MVLLYLAIVVRALVRLLDEDNLFIVLAASGLVALFGGQAFVNILVNLQLFPSKGLTLPLVSYGGSSTVAQCLLVGLLLAITRQQHLASYREVGPPPFAIPVHLGDFVPQPDPLPLSHWLRAVPVNILLRVSSFMPGPES